MVVHLLHCSIFVSSTTSCSKRQQRCPARYILLNALFWKKCSWQHGCHPLLLPDIPFTEHKAHLRALFVLQIGKPEIYVFVRGGGNPDGRLGQKFISGEIWDKSKLCSTLDSSPFGPFASCIKSGWFLCVYTSLGIHMVPLCLLACCVEIHSPVAFGLTATGTPLLPAD